MLKRSLPLKSFARAGKRADGMVPAGHLFILQGPQLPIAFRKDVPIIGSYVNQCLTYKTSLYECIFNPTACH